MNRVLGAVLLAAALLPAARAQFVLSAVAGTVEVPVGALYDLGTVSSGDAVAAHFRLRNTTNAAATLTLLRVAGVGFALTAAPSLPVALNPQGTVDFTVSFSAPAAGQYTAVFSADGVSALLAAAVVPGLTVQVETAAGKLSPGNSPVDFGSVEMGQVKHLHFDIDNRTTITLAVPPVAVGGGDFAVSGTSPSGIQLKPATGTSFDVQFSPTAAGPRSASLSIGGHLYGLIGTGTAPVLPRPQVTIDLAHMQSAQQGSVRVLLASPAVSSGSGTLTLAFQPALTGAADPSIVFASGGNSATFNFGPGDTEGRFGTQAAASFQTGTTAGNLVFTAQLGGFLDQQTVSIAATPVGITAAQATRSSGSLAMQITGFDNTRTASALTFTFFDSTGNALAPGPIQADATAAFAAYFQGSIAGGSFVVRAQFPVTGDTAQIASFAAAIKNSAGTAATARTPF